MNHTEIPPGGISGLSPIRERSTILDRIGKLPRILILAVSFSLILAIGVVDHFTKEDISVYVFYSLPIFLAAWFLGSTAGFLAALFSAIAWLVVDLLELPTPVHSLIYGNAFVRLTFFSAIALVISALKGTLDREVAFAHKDFLTGLPNRRAFFESANTELLRAKRYERPFTIAFIDLDSFKQINDRLGHQTGDNLLVCVAQTLRKNTRATDLIARLGGDEFVVLLPETSEDSARAALLKLQTELCAVMQRNQWDVTFSIGAATYVQAPSSVDEMLSRADNLMYAAKREGRNLIRFQSAKGV